MPSRSRRRETDIRADRLESEIRSAEAAQGVFQNRRALPMCSRCGRTFEETSKWCPRCDTKTMGLIKPVPERHVEEYRRNALRRAGGGR